MEGVDSFKESWAIKFDKITEGTKVIGYYTDGSIIGGYKYYSNENEEKKFKEEKKNDFYDKNKKGILISIGLNHWSSDQSIKILLNSIKFVAQHFDWSPSFHHLFSPFFKRFVFFFLLFVHRNKMEQKFFLPRPIVYIIFQYSSKLN